MKKGFSLKKYNTFQIDAYCHEIHFIHVEKDLIEFYGKKESEFLILGGGSNVLMLDNINRIILKNEIKGKEILHEDDEHVTVRVGGGENWHEFVQWSLTQGYSGIENLSLIPGSVGAAPVQNIGAYGVELDEVFVRLEGIQLEEGILLSLNKIACQFSYRDSIFKHSLKDKFFISYVHFKLNKRFIPRLEYGTIKQLLSERAMSEPTADQVSALVCEIRESKLPNPNVLGNAGSFFKNTIVSKEKFNLLLLEYPTIPYFPTDSDQIKIPTGWLIEQCNWKGKRIGDVSSYEKQALVLVNYGSASGYEVLNYAKLIMDDVEEKFGILIHPEVNIWK